MTGQIILYSCLLRSRRLKQTHNCTNLNINVSPVLQEMPCSTGGFLLNKFKFPPETMSYSLQFMLQFQECTSSLQISGSISEIISTNQSYVMTLLIFMSSYKFPEVFRVPKE